MMIVVKLKKIQKNKKRINLQVDFQEEDDLERNMIYKRKKKNQWASNQLKQTKRLIKMKLKIKKNKKLEKAS